MVERERDPTAREGKRTAVGDGRALIESAKVLDPQGSIDTSAYPHEGIPPGTGKTG